MEGKIHNQFGEMQTNTDHINIGLVFQQIQGFVTSLKELVHAFYVDASLCIWMKMPHIQTWHYQM